MWHKKISLGEFSKVDSPKNIGQATTEKNNGQEMTTWYSCAKWGESAILQYLKKGTKISLNVTVRELELLCVNFHQQPCET